MREGEVLVHEGARRERTRIEFARREQHVSHLAVDHVAVVVHTDEIIICPDRLQLAEGLEERLTIPESHVVERRAVPDEVLGAQHLIPFEFAQLDLVESPGTPRGCDVMLDLRRLAREFVRLHHEALVQRRKDGREDQ